jgi:hypothetical protein
VYPAESDRMDSLISEWESEGGLFEESSGQCEMRGTVNQIAWAKQIRVQVEAEFERVANALAALAVRQSSASRRDTFTLIAILYEKRAEVMAQPDAGYFIHDWQELRDQVRRLIMADARYKSIKPARST